MANDSVQVLYTRKAKLYQFLFINFLRWEKVLETFFRKNRYIFSGMRILDAGCGTGSVTRVLYELAHHQCIDKIIYHAFDLTPAMLEFFNTWMKKEEVEDIQLHQANVLNLENQIPPDWTGYDLIVSSAMLEHIPKEKLGLALGNLRRLINENGRLLVFATKRTWIAKWTGTKWWGTNLFDPAELEKLLHQAGFITVQFKKMPKNWNSFMLAVEADLSPR